MTSRCRTGRCSWLVHGAFTFRSCYADQIFVLHFFEELWMCSTHGMACLGHMQASMHLFLGKRWLRQIAGAETEKRRSSAALPGQGPSSQGHIKAERPTRTVSRSQGRGKRVGAPQCHAEPGCKSSRQRFTRRWKQMVVLASTCV